MVFINIRRKMNKLSKNKWDYDLITSSLVCKFVKKNWKIPRGNVESRQNN
jgi:hypothetical protein